MLSKCLENYTFSRVLTLDDYEKFKVPDSTQAHFNYKLSEIVEQFDMCTKFSVNPKIIAEELRKRLFRKVACVESDEKFSVPVSSEQQAPPLETQLQQEIVAGAVDLGEKIRADQHERDMNCVDALSGIMARESFLQKIVIPEQCEVAKMISQENVQ